MKDQDFLRVVSKLYDQYLLSPVAPYTFYVLLALSTALFFVLWRRAAARAKVASATYDSLTRIVGNPAATQQSMFNSLHETQRHALQVIHDVQSNTLKAVREMQSESLNKLATANADALAKIDSIVDSFTSNDEDE